MTDNAQQFGLIVIGDEILIGKRQDRHFEFFRELLLSRGLSLAWLQVLADDPLLLTERLRATMAESLPVFCCGGIGATPDDHTRGAAAAAAGVDLVVHPEFRQILENKFGDDAYPNRILMAELPAGAALIPNAYNGIPGFSFASHYFLPGFPVMAQPMARWVLDNHYPEQGKAFNEVSVRVDDVPESELIPLMHSLGERFPAAKVFSLPRAGERRFVELGIRGEIEPGIALAALQRALTSAGYRFTAMED